MIWTVTGVTEREYIGGGPFWVSLARREDRREGDLAEANWSSIRAVADELLGKGN
jgi:hypothetical protein